MLNVAGGFVCSSGTDSGDEEDSEERRQKVSFVQELVFSTLF